MLILICFMSLFLVSAEILKSSLSTMERHIQRLENDIENFPKTDDLQDKFVAKMSISFLFVHLHFCMSEFCHCFICTGWYKNIICAVLSVAAVIVLVCVVSGSRKQFKSLGMIGDTPEIVGNGSGCLTVKCWSHLPLHSTLCPKSKIMPMAIFTAPCHCCLSPEGL